MRTDRYRKWFSSEYPIVTYILTSRVGKTLSGQISGADGKIRKGRYSGIEFD